MVTLLEPDGFHILAADALADAGSSWSVGTFGAVAAFLRLPTDPVVLQQADGSAVAITTGGGIRLRTDRSVRPIAYERPTGRRSWTCGVAFCLHEDDVKGAARTVVTDLGPDGDALRPADREGVLVDLGVGVPHLEICVRTADPGLLDVLRAADGSPLDRDLRGALREAGPDRIFRTPLGRVEVYGRIPSRRSISPAGPHTHLLPRLLQNRRTHAETEPIPEGWVPCAHLYPPHPTRDVLGRDVAFNTGRDAAAQSLLDRFGHPDARSRARDVLRAVRDGLAPTFLPPVTAAVERAAQKVALRRLAHLDGPSAVLLRWLEACDPGSEAPAEDPIDVLAG